MIQIYTKAVFTVYILRVRVMGMHKMSTAPTLYNGSLGWKQYKSTGWLSMGISIKY